MLNKILYQIFWLSLTALVIGFLSEIIDKEVSYYISVFLTILGFIIFPEKKDFGSRKGMLLFPILAIIVFNFTLILTSTEAPVPIIIINVLIGLFCFFTSYFSAKGKSTDNY